MHRTASFCFLRFIFDPYILHSVDLDFYSLCELQDSDSIYSGYQSHAPFNDFFPFQKLSFGGRQSNVSMTIVVFISCQFHGHVRPSL